MHMEEEKKVKLAEVVLESDSENGESDSESGSTDEEMQEGSNGRDFDSEEELFGFGEEDSDMEEERDVAEEQRRGGQERLEEWRQVKVRGANARVSKRAGEREAWLPTFNGARCGPQRVWSSKDPYDFFMSLFTPDILENIAVETNRYAESVLASRSLPPHSRYKEWKPTTREEIERFLGVQIAMGLCTKPWVTSYWSKDSQQLNWTPNYSRVMPRSRYQLLHACLHFNDNTLRSKKGDVNYDPLFKIRPLIDAVLRNCREEYYPHQILSVDRNMISFNGRVFFRQYMYMKSKRVRLRMSSFVLSDSQTKYTYLWDVCTGGATRCDREMRKGYRAVTQLMQEASLLGMGHIVYTDKSYTSPALFLHLHNQGTGACGTAKKNHRGMPPQLFDFDLKSNDPPIFYEKKPLLASTFRDGCRTVTALSTVHDASVISKRVKNKVGTGHRTLVRPKCAEDYNSHKGGVDRDDELSSYYSSSRRIMKWYIRLYHHIREVALVNAHILFREATGIAMRSQDFRTQVVAGLVGSTLKDAPPPPPKDLPGVPHRLTGRHFLDQRKGIVVDCRVCSNRKRGAVPAEGSKKKTGRKQTPFYCKTCPEEPSLCPVPCFEMYHTKLVFK